MTRQAYLMKYGSEFKTFIESPAGIEMLGTLNAMAPAYESSEHAHLYADNRGAKRGYQLCVNNIFGLSFTVKQDSSIDANYGVEDKA